ncbi:hypothetical protein D3C85_1943690 [compost metagenome]
MLIHRALSVVFGDLCIASEVWLAQPIGKDVVHENTACTVKQNHNIPLEKGLFLNGMALLLIKPL